MLTNHSSLRPSDVLAALACPPANAIQAEEKRLAEVAGRNAQRVEEAKARMGQRFVLHPANSPQRIDRVSVAYTGTMLLKHPHGMGLVR